MHTAEEMEWLRQYLVKYPLQKKILLVPSFAQGHQMLERIVRSGQPLVNVIVHTIESLILEHTAYQLHREKVQYADSSRTYWLIHSLMHELANETDSYIPLDLIQPGVVRLMHQAISELRMAGVGSHTLQIDSFLDTRKGIYLKELYRRYEETLCDQQLVDFAGLNAFVQPSREHVHYLVFPHALPDLISKKMLEKLAGAYVEVPDIGKPFYTKESGFPAERVEMFHVSGAIAEAREVFRRVMSRQIRLDQVEVVVSDYEQYAGIFYTLSYAHGLPCTFAEGLPLEICSAGRAAMQFMNWVDNDFPIQPILMMLLEGTISFRKYDEAGNNSRWASYLERLGIGSGRERYDRLLLPQQGSDEAVQHLTESVRQVFQSIWSFLPDSASERWTVGSIIRAAASFVEHFGSANSEEDVKVAKQLRQIAESLTGGDEVYIQKDLALRYAKEVISNIRTYVTSIPEPGKLHISSLSSGGYSGRENTYIVGMDERSWSSGTRQDPVLLDEERVRISPALQLSVDRMQQSRLQCDATIGKFRGQVTMSCSCYDPLDKEMIHPAFEMLQTYRIKTGNEEADFTALHADLGEPIGYWCSNANDALDQGDRWSQELAGRNGTAGWINGLEAVERVKTMLSHGRRASLARRAKRLSQYDGWISRVDLNTDRSSESPAISASRLEHYARCPMQYYFSYELGLWPKEANEHDPSAWLRPDQRGTLLHEVYYRYLYEADRDREGQILHDRDKLYKITNEVITKFADTVPFHSPFLFEKECRELHEDIEVYYKRELGCSDRPILFEQELAIHGEPLLIKLEDELHIRMKGFVDRIDQVGPHRYRIIDYKTGNPNKYSESSYFNEGTQLQHALYAVAAEEWMRQSGFDEQAVVTESAYLFPTVRGQGEQVVKIQNRRKELAYIVGLLLDSMRSGVYVPTQDKSKCKWCHYNRVCGPHAEWMEEKRTFEENTSILQSLLEVESIE
ncbi:PD-(D/E)XK nuclease family protein [Paenibacillus sp. ATY16]|nr:PD-(D/E)XK nuclease family protein [Paenibacillus sp. ATY16]